MPAKPVRSSKIYSMTAAILAWPRGVGLLRRSRVSARTAASSYSLTTWKWGAGQDVPLPPDFGTSCATQDPSRSRSRSPVSPVPTTATMDAELVAGAVPGVVSAAGMFSAPRTSSTLPRTSSTLPPGTPTLPSCQALCRPGLPWKRCSRRLRCLWACRLQWTLCPLRLLLCRVERVQRQRLEWKMKCA